MPWDYTYIIKVAPQEQLSIKIQIHFYTVLTFFFSSMTVGWTRDPLHLKHEVLTAVPPEKSLFCLLLVADS